MSVPPLQSPPSRELPVPSRIRTTMMHPLLTPHLSTIWLRSQTRASSPSCRRPIRSLWWLRRGLAKPLRVPKSKFAAQLQIVNGTASLLLSITQLALLLPNQMLTLIKWWTTMSLMCLRSPASLDLHPSTIRWSLLMKPHHAQCNSMSHKRLIQATVLHQPPCTTKTIAALAPTASTLPTSSTQLLPQLRTRRSIRPRPRAASPLFPWQATTPQMDRQDTFHRVITLPLNKQMEIQVLWPLQLSEQASLLSRPFSCEQNTWSIAVDLISNLR